MPSTRIVIADDHAIVRDALRDLLCSFGSVEIVAEACHGIEALAAVKTEQPDLLLLDIAMPFVGGLEIIEEIRQWSPRTRIAVFTGVQSGGVIGELQRLGVQGIVLKGASSREMQHGMQQLLAGERFFCSGARSLASATESLANLTARERQVLQQVVSGASNAAIAERFNISPKTVDNHRTNLMRKLDVHSVGGLIQIALREGLITATGPSPAE